MVLVGHRSSPRSCTRTSEVHSHSRNRRRWPAHKQVCPCSCSVLDTRKSVSRWSECIAGEFRSWHSCRQLRKTGHPGNTLFFGVRSPRFWVSGYCTKWRIQSSFHSSDVITSVRRQNVAQKLNTSPRTRKMNLALKVKFYLDLHVHVA